MGQIGEPEEYIVTLEDASVIFSSGYYFDSLGSTVDNSAVLHEVPWSDLQWGRCANRTSVATVTIPNDEWGKTLCPYPLKGWDQALVIYRNGLRVWAGPLLGWRRTSAGQIQVTARDLLAFGERGLALDDVVVVGGELWQAVSDYIAAVQVTTHATTPYPIMDPIFMHPGESSAIGITKTFVGAEARYMSDVLSELSSEYNLFYSAGPDGVHYSRTEFYFGTAAPALHEGSVLNAPVVVVDCSEVATMLFALSDNAGGGGYRTILDAAMVELVGAGAYSDSFSLASVIEPSAHAVGDELTVAATKKSVETLVPKTTIEALKLAPSFGSISNQKDADDRFRGFEDINDLRPGMVARWGFDEDCLSEVPIASLRDPNSRTGFFLTSRIVAVELVQLDVSATRRDDGLSEVISASFVPIADARFSSVEYPVEDGASFTFQSTEEP